jgi:hypothetical protein
MTKLNDTFRDGNPAEAQRVSIIAMHAEGVGAWNWRMAAMEIHQQGLIDAPPRDSELPKRVASDRLRHPGVN